MTTGSDTISPSNDADSELEERFRRAGEKAAEIKRAAYASYSEAASVVRERALELEEVLRRGGTAEAVERHREALAVAVQMKDLAQHEHEAADQNWREWLEEHRARQQDELLRRQEGIGKSAMRAAWAAALAAGMSVVVAAWELFGPTILATLRR